MWIRISERIAETTRTDEHFVTTTVNSDLVERVIAIEGNSLGIRTKPKGIIVIMSSGQQFESTTTIDEWEKAIAADV